MYVMYVMYINFIFDLCNTAVNNCTKLHASLFTRWVLHVSAKQCQTQGAAKFLSELLRRQYDRMQVMERMVQAYVPVCYVANSQQQVLRRSKEKKSPSKRLNNSVEQSLL
jgi:DNA-binding transcriptional regulator YbjK